jgi:hypothetical protein
MLADLTLSHVERAVALLWYYRQSQEFEERTAAELSIDLHDEGFPKPNITRLREDLVKSRYTISGHRKGSFQLDLRRLSELDLKYGDILKIKKVEVGNSIIPNDWVSGTRKYLEDLTLQINGCYEYEFYDGCATLCRRLMESLIIETYIAEKRHHEIQDNGVFFALERLIGCICSNSRITLGRNTRKTMMEIKQLGDTAAHDRVYITHKQDIDDVKGRYRQMIKELLVTAKIRK